MAKRIYVGNLSDGTTENQLRRLFAETGRVESVRVLFDRKAWPTIVAFVEMGDNDAKRAIDRLNGRKLNGRNIDLRDLADPAAWIRSDRVA